jgi:hypothetical protein
MDREVEVGDGTRLLVRGMEDDGRVVNVDVEIVEATGARWVATVLTLAEISRLMRSYRESGECLSGRYSRVPDLMILDTRADAPCRWEAGRDQEASLGQSSG